MLVVDGVVLGRRVQNGQREGNKGIMWICGFCLGQSNRVKTKRLVHFYGQGFLYWTRSENLWENRIEKRVLFTGECEW